MLQSLRNRRNRKGFTLAELLIVVAIIAVLVAIAVPLFVSGLNDAEKATYQANRHAVKSAAVVSILERDLDISSVDGTKNWLQATATLTEDGDINSVKVEIVNSDPKETSFEAWKTARKSATYEMIIEIAKTDVTIS